jgi:tRNA (cytidine/uridine-2'-O-)-methyltransferase
LSGVEPWLHVVLFQPEIPQNTGNIGRSCVAINAKLWLVRPLGFQLQDRQLKRAGLDYWPHLQWEVVDDWEALERALPGRRFWMFTKFARQSYWEVKYQVGDCLVFGSETSGLPESLHQPEPFSCCRDWHVRSISTEPRSLPHGRFRIHFDRITPWKVLARNAPRDADARRAFLKPIARRIHCEVSRSRLLHSDSSLSCFLASPRYWLAH